MKKVIDLTKSKRPYLEPEMQDATKIQESKIVLEDEISVIENEIQARNDNPEWQRVLLNSYRKMEKIAYQTMDIDPRTMTPEQYSTKMATARGQFFERKALTEEMLSLHNVVKEKKSLRDRLDEILKNINQKLHITKNKE